MGMTKLEIYIGKGEVKTDFKRTVTGERRSIFTVSKNSFGLLHYKKKFPCLTLSD